MKKNGALPIPDGADVGGDASEILRVWLVNGSPHLSLQSSVWADPAGWGILFADLAHHLANSYQLEHRMDPAKVISRIRVALDAEFGSRTDKGSGKLK